MMMLKLWRPSMFKNNTFFYLLVIVILSSCGQDYNSNSNDAEVYSDIGITPGSNLYEAYTLMQTKCFACHGKEWRGLTTSQMWIDKGLIVSGSPTNSSIYTSLTNNGGDMPKNPYPPLTRSEVLTIKNWINNP